MSIKIARVPQIMQMESVECGAACLAMILAYYGRWVPLEQVRTDCGVSRDGSKITNILRAARSYGMEAKGMSVSLDAMRKQGLFPCIVYWNFNHFVVVDGARGNKVWLNDPARGHIAVSRSEFDDCYTGIALVFKLTEAFTPGGSKPDPVRYVRTRLKGMGSAILLVTLTTAVTSLAAILFTSSGTVFLDRILSGYNTEWLIPLLTIMLILAVIQGSIAILNSIYLVKIQGKTAVVSSSRFMNHLLRLPVRFYSMRSTGDLQMRQIDNESIVYAMVVQLAPVLISGIMLVLYLMIMLHYSLILTCVGVCAVFLNIFVARFISRKRINATRRLSANAGKMYATTVSGIDMIETIQASGAENHFFSRWAGYQALVSNDRTLLSYINEYLGMIPNVLCQFANIAVLVIGIRLIVQGDFTPGALLAFCGFLSAFMTPVSQLINLGQTIQEATTQMERIEDVMRYPEDVEETSGEDLPENIDIQKKLPGRLEIKDVSFGYSPLDPPLIEGLSLTLEPGKWVALVGASGCGKSTIAKLITGLYPAWSGEILLDGIPMEKIPKPVFHNSVMMVDQDMVSFDDTVANNIKLWDNSIEDYEMIMACMDAEVHEDILSRPYGYHVMVQPGGKNFSGGQLQRMEIAHALAADPTLLILDEATSALDAQTEERVISHIRDRGISCVVIAHRLSTIRDCDEIIVLDKGKVRERGTHQELMKLDGAYAALVRSN
ncbi:NHLM bacteriocin system ABC transporter, peptidase/ATP-binding protein [Ruminococcaceae bacterium YRB3002]|nr:NHLM bacteriocin system ABC transporter, peptidase/ATP-binding protein [Ruminococcaceae bacterium YRB3002]